MLVRILGLLLPALFLFLSIEYGCNGQDQWLVKGREYFIQHGLYNAYLTIKDDGGICDHLAEVYIEESYRNDSRDQIWKLNWLGDDIWSYGGELSNDKQLNLVSMKDFPPNCYPVSNKFEFHRTFNNYKILERSSTPAWCLTYNGTGNKVAFEECLGSNSNQIWSLNWYLPKTTKE